MKHLKTYEEVCTQPEEGDYVIVINYLKSEYSLNDWLSSNIGKIIKDDYSFYEFSFSVLYENIPKEYLGFFKGKKLNNVSLTNIKYWSKNKEDLESFLSASRYNL